MKSGNILIILLSLSSYLSMHCSDDKIKIYAIYTPSHQELVEKWFLPSIKDDFEIILEKHNQLSPTGEFSKEGWRETMLFKVDVVIRGIQENWNKIFIHSDVDVQFFKPFKKVILKLMKNKDMVVQRNRPGDKPQGEMCAGFFACRGNEKTLKLWQEIRRKLVKTNTNDQVELNRLVLKNNVFDLAWEYLPVEFFCGGTFTGHGWAPGRKLKIPKNILLHHANWTIGVKNKIAQLEYVRKTVFKERYRLADDMYKSPDYEFEFRPRIDQEADNFENLEAGM